MKELLYDLGKVIVMIFIIPLMIIDYLCGGLNEK
jgi:hypothetical protein